MNTSNMNPTRVTSHISTTQMSPVFFLVVSEVTASLTNFKTKNDTLTTEATCCQISDVSPRC